MDTSTKLRIFRQLDIRPKIILKGAMRRKHAARIFFIYNLQTKLNSKWKRKFKVEVKFPVEQKDRVCES